MKFYHSQHQIGLYGRRAPVTSDPHTRIQYKYITSKPKMLTENPAGHESPSFFPSECMRRQRLTDVKRGTKYYKKLDQIADMQWKTNVPKFDDIPRKMSILPKIVTPVLSESGQLTRRSNFFNMTSTPRQSVSYMSAGMGSVLRQYSRMTNSQLSLPSHLSKEIQYRPSNFDSRLEPMIEEEKTSKNFNPWGTSHSALDVETRLTADDLKPRELPFLYRDNRKIVVKPSPRKSMPMSRVAATERDRHQRTVTNFRSRNGRIRIIKPLDPLPEVEKYQKSCKQDAFDIENIEREKTFMMLERINRILHPNKKSTKTVLGSSEEEIQITSDSSHSITDYQMESRENPITVKMHDKESKYLESPLLSPRVTPMQENSSIPKWRKSMTPPVHKSRIKFNEDAFKLRAPMAFADVLHSLDILQEDNYVKCQSWINTII